VTDILVFLTGLSSQVFFNILLKLKLRGYLLYSFCSVIQRSTSVRCKSDCREAGLIRSATNQGRPICHAVVVTTMT